ncbi:MAG: hypothetical protein HYW06_03465 [Gemmatimonadetes bacterium]|nr:hypothetical protein [Gemmatimonadota bacterium]MBI2402512.1 hypothetical protein [Gemmatimonadota bacterium]MBI2536024.1 hypothetical protein [Gemmatimonadota bacterium]
MLFGKKKAVIVKVEATNILWQGHQDPQTGTWVGVCKALNLNAAGDTFQELQACANDAMALLFTDLLNEGELADFLRVNGWSLGTQLPAPGIRPLFDIPADWNSKARYEELVPAVR